MLVNRPLDGTRVPPFPQATRTRFHRLLCYGATPTHGPPIQFCRQPRHSCGARGWCGLRMGPLGRVPLPNVTVRRQGREYRAVACVV